MREFHQFGVEVFGAKSAETDAEVIFAASTFLNKLGIKKTELQINSIGCRICRAEYNKALKEYFRPHLAEMCETCRSRFDKNPLRMLDCKEEKCKKITADAPKILDFLCEDCNTHFEKVKSLLSANKVPYVVNSGIVRGLDYYTKTVFEFVSTDIGAQGAVCAGGRYDNLVEELGGPSLPAIGFAAGIERLMLLMENTGVSFPDGQKPLIYVAGMDDATRAKAFEIVARLRANGVNAEADLMERSVKAQFKYADKLGAQYVAVIGGNELISGEANIKNMTEGTQTAVKFGEIYSYLIKEIK